VSREAPFRVTAAVTTWLVAPPDSRSARLAVSVGAPVATILIALLDYVTTRAISLAILYLIPAAVAAVVVSTRLGYWVAVESGLVSSLAQQYEQPNQVFPISLLRGVLLLTVVSTVVFLVGALREAAMASANASRAHRGFLAMAAHQMRTPIAGVVVSAEALAVERDPERRARLTENLIEGTDRVGRLLSELLAVSRIEQNHAWEVRPTDLVELIREELHSVEARVPSILVEAEGPDALTIPANSDGIRAAVSNLLDNAVRHATSRVRLSVGTEPGLAVIEVTDDGPGLRPGEEERAFERFVVLDGCGGTGLGLPIARGMVRAHGGDLRWTGGSFRITLPVG
jgi:signal transduction histidine kinase